MAKASWTSIGVVIALGLSLIHPMGAVAKTAAAPAFDDELEQGYVEVPIESIQQFVQIYGLVKDNYVAERSDEALFQQAIKENHADDGFKPSCLHRVLTENSVR